MVYVLAWHVLSCMVGCACEAGIIVLIGMRWSWVGEGAGRVGLQGGATAPDEAQHHSFDLPSPLTPPVLRGWMRLARFICPAFLIQW
jgi:hypothetical protein